MKIARSNIPQNNCGWRNGGGGESEEVLKKYRRRSGIEATNAKLKRTLKIGRLRVRGLVRARHAVMLKALGWKIQ